MDTSKNNIQYLATNQYVATTVPHSIPSTAYRKPIFGNLCPRCHLSSGQAMIELMVGLIALVVLVAGMLQVASLTKAQTDTMVEARSEAGRNAFGSMGMAEIPEYIHNIDAGPDHRTYSYDDSHTLASGGNFHDIIVSKATSDGGQWQLLSDARNKSFSVLNNSGSPISVFGLLKGSASETVDVQPAVRSLLYRADQIQIKSDVWITWTQGIY